MAAVALLAAAFPSLAVAENAIEPPISYLSPAMFKQVPVTHGGVEVTYTCPSYPGGDASDYAVRFSNGEARGNDGRLGTGGPYWVAEAAALTGPSPGICHSQLLLPSSPYPAALFLGPIAWQVSRRCPRCQQGWEVAPLSWSIVTPNVEGAELSGPRKIYAGYLARFTFKAASDLSGTEIAVQGIGRKFGGGWTDLARAPMSRVAKHLLPQAAGRDPQAPRQHLLRQLEPGAALPGSAGAAAERPVGDQRS